MTREQQLRESAVEGGLKKLEPLGINGGELVMLREVLAQMWDAGLSYGLWEPQDAPRTTSEALGRPQMARGAQRPVETLPEGTEPIPGKPDGFWKSAGPEIIGADLKTWWMEQAEAESSQLVAKATEYGGTHRAQDLTDIGRDLIAAGVAKGPLLGSGAVQEGWMQELGCYFYLRGKVGRWTAAIAEGRPVSDDTLHDIGIYVRMVQRIRAVGGWPV